MTTVAGARWRKASRSANEGNCVEVHGGLDQVRDSKNPAGPTLVVDAAGLVAAVKTGRIGR